MQRLFVAIDIPDEHRALIHSLCYGLPDARWVQIEQLHITLRFIGEVDETTFHHLADHLADVKGKSFHIVVKGIDHFPPRREPKVLWLGVTPDDQLRLLRKRIDSSLMETGVKPEGRIFSPHITIARFKNSPPPNRMAEYLATYSMFETRAFEVNTFHLYSSHLTGKGTAHQIECSYPLAP